MATSQRHIIKNQVMEVKVFREEDAFALRQQLGKLYIDRILPKLDDLLSSLVAPDQHLLLDNLEIEMGEIDPFSDQDFFIEKFIRQFKQAIKAKLKNANLQQRDLQVIEQEKPNNQTPLDSRDAVIWTASSEQHVMQQFLYFLETGLMPWWSGGHSMEAFIKKLLASLPNQFSKISKTLSDLFKDQPISRRRLVRQFPLEVQSTLLYLAHDFTPQQVEYLWQWTEKCLGKKAFKHHKPELFATLFHSKPQALEDFTELVFFIYIKNKNEPKSTGIPNTEIFSFLDIKIRTTILKIWKEQSTHSIKKAPSEGRDTTDITKKSPEPQNQAGQSKQNKQEKDHTQDSKPPFSPNEETSSLTRKGKAKKEDNTLDISNKKPIKVNQNEEQNNERGTLKKHYIEAQRRKIKTAFEEGVVIQNAGLVLLASFFYQFFKNLKMLENKDFKTEITRQRAVLLTQFLVDEKTETPEYELTLNKLLCGMEQEQTLDNQIKITEEQKEAKELLNYLIQEWKALKSTSPELLQSAFLQREGRLSFNDGSWLLQIEQKTHDILLSRIPWGFSLIKLPWMVHFLHVEWA